MSDDTILVFHGFLNLTTRDKIELVNAINEYFDSNHREPIREANTAALLELDLQTKACKCCGK